MSVVTPQHTRPATLALVLAVCAWIAGGCATGSPAPTAGPASVDAGAYAYFEQASALDPWTPKIAGWQMRERAQPRIEALAEKPPAVSKGSRPVVPLRGESLRDRYFRYRNDSKRAMAQDLAGWMQSVAKRHYVPDGLVDHWATLEETLDRNGDDCDGLELLAYHFLRDHGFSEDEVFRAVIYRPKDGQHHMVTLWFESPSDPWVLDPTGAMTSGMPRMSERPDWVPLKIFSEKTQYTVRPISGAAASPAWSWNRGR